jgi:hypothetical protein
LGKSSQDQQLDTFQGKRKGDQSFIGFTDPLPLETSSKESIDRCHIIKNQEDTLSLLLTGNFQVLLEGESARERERKGNTNGFSPFLF